MLLPHVNAPRVRDWFGRFKVFAAISAIEALVRAVSPGWMVSVWQSKNLTAELAYGDHRGTLDHMPERRGSVRRPQRESVSLQSQLCPQIPGLRVSPLGEVSALRFAIFMTCLTRVWA